MTVYVVLLETQDDPSEIVAVCETEPTEEALKAIPVGAFQGIRVEKVFTREL